MADVTDPTEAVRRRLAVFMADADAAGEHRVLVYREDVRALLAAHDAAVAEVATLNYLLGEAELGAREAETQRLIATRDHQPARLSGDAHG